MMKWFCCGCGAEMKEGQSVNSGTKHFCSEDCKELYFMDGCSRWHKKDTSRCPACGKLVYKDKAVARSGKWFCDDACKKSYDKMYTAYRKEQEQKKQKEQSRISTLAKDENMDYGHNDFTPIAQPHPEIKVPPKKNEPYMSFRERMEARDRRERNEAALRTLNSQYNAGTVQTVRMPTPVEKVEESTKAKEECLVGVSVNVEEGTMAKKPTEKRLLIVNSVLGRVAEYLIDSENYCIKIDAHYLQIKRTELDDFIAELTELKQFAEVYNV